MWYNHQCNLRIGILFSFLWGFSQVITSNDTKQNPFCFLICLFLWTVVKWKGENYTLCGKLAHTVFVPFEDPSIAFNCEMFLDFFFFSEVNWHGFRMHNALCMYYLKWYMKNLVHYLERNVYFHVSLSYINLKHFILYFIGA